MVNFHVGQKVVCVDAYNTPGRILGPIVEGDVYTIKSIFPAEPGMFAPKQHADCCVNVLLHETPDWTFGYRASRFRPIVTTDISVFTAMLASAPRKVEEPA